MRFFQEMSQPGFPSTVVFVGAALIVGSVLLPLTLRFFAVSAGLVLLLGAMLFALDAAREDDVQARSGESVPVEPVEPAVFAEIDRALGRGGT